MRSIRRRLIVGLTAGVCVVWLCGALLSATTLVHELDEVFDESLREASRRLLALVVRDVVGGTSMDAPVAPLENALVGLSSDGDDYREELLSFVVRDGDGRILLVSHGAHESDFPADAPEGFSRDGDFRFYVESALDGAVSIQVADPLWHRREAAKEAVLAVAAPLPVLVVLGVVLGWIIAGLALGGVREMRTALESRGGRNLEPLVLDDVPLELRPVVDAVNRMLERLGGVLESERGVASGTAHELRTPIAAALLETQRLARTLPADHPREHVENIERMLSDLARLAEKLVQLGRAESGFMNTGERRDGAGIVPLVLDEFRSHGIDRHRLRYRVVGAEPCLETCLDPDGLGIVIRNLVENALKHGVPGTPVDITLDASANTLSIVNEIDSALPNGPGALMARFVRGPTNASGTGLGLAIVEAVLRGTDLALELRSPSPDRELTFEATLSAVVRPSPYRRTSPHTARPHAQPVRRNATGEPSTSHESPSRAPRQMLANAIGAETASSDIAETP